MQATAATVAPWLMPRMSGLARPLRAMRCVIAPESPSAAPTARPTRLRASRQSMTTVRWSFVPPPARTRTTSTGLMGNCPMPRLSTHTSAQAASNTVTARTARGW